MVDKRVSCSIGRIGPQQAPTVVLTKKIVSATSALDAGPVFATAAPDPSSIPMPTALLLPSRRPSPELSSLSEV
jgi:hypothetical protein